MVIRAVRSEFKFLSNFAIIPLEKSKMEPSNSDRINNETEWVLKTLIEVSLGEILFRIHSSRKMQREITPPYLSGNHGNSHILKKRNLWRDMIARDLALKK